ncbi:MAG: SPFH domain-containing protein [Clostridiales bacterium]|jgi:membrane protease subunit (stomatin/prohibitin family)|nr:SPFH domain-containing protein [Clostridiales bacterium]
MGFIKKQLLKVIEWKDPTNDVIVYRYPTDDRYAVMNGSQLVVRESQCAVFVLEGVAGDVFGPGRHKLEASSLPILTAIKNWKYAFENPYQGEVYFINTKQFTDRKWGTTNPIMMRDKDFGVIRLRGFGSYAFAVNDPRVFMKELFGTNKLYTVRDIEDYLKKIIVSRLSDVIAESKIAALDLAAKYDELGKAARIFLQEDLNNIGLKLSALYVENLSLPPEVEKSLDTRTTLGVLGDSMDKFTQYQTASALREAANNPSGGLAGAGIGLGAGITMGNIFAEAMRPRAAAESKAADIPAAKCSKCGAAIKEGVKFCPECGAKQETSVCPSCGKPVKPGAKFCPECGAAVSAKKTCPHCGASMPAHGKFCPECGKST